jgi:RNA polymerase sigma factor (sigma-70 family)
MAATVGTKIRAEVVREVRQPHDEDEWSNLMAAAQNGDRVAYNTLLKEISGWLQRYYARRVPPTMVEDLKQEALIGIHQRRMAYEPNRPFGPWLASIARYKWIDHLRLLGRQSTLPLDDDFPGEDYEAAISNRLFLDRLMRRLKPAQLTVIQLAKLRGFSVEEVATATGQSSSLVKVNIHRGLAKLAAIVRTDPSVT